MSAEHEEAAAADAVLSEFFAAAHTAPAAHLTTATTLLTLIRNAVRVPPKDTYRRVRLSNPKIRQRVVDVPGALDVLGMAGFERVVLDGEDVLIYSDGGGGDGGRRCRVAEGICARLEERIVALRGEEDGKAAAADRKQGGAAKTVPKKKPTATTLLSEEERRERVRREKAARRAREAERRAVRRRWEEDKREREEAAEWRERARAAAAASESVVGEGIRIRPLVVEPRPNAVGEPEAPAAPEASAAPEPSPLAAVRAEAAARRSAALASVRSNSQVDQQTSGQREENRESVGAADAVGDAAMTTAALQKEQGGGAMEIEERSEPEATTSEEGMDKKPAAKTSAPPGGKCPQQRQEQLDESWAACLETLPRCAAAEGIRESSVFCARASASSSDAAGTGTGTGTGRCLRRLLRELSSLGESLPSDRLSSAWVRFDEETPQYLRAIIAAPPGTPYAGGLFAFDVHVPDDYPRVPPKVKILTTGGGTVRFGPNLYADGMVCLSLLGTWPGPRWDPKRSSLHQVLVSLQGLVLGVEHPFYLEPGHGGWEGRVKEGQFQTTGHTLKGEEVKEELHLPAEVRAYDDALHVGTVRYAMMEVLRAATPGTDAAVASAAAVGGKEADGKANDDQPPGTASRPWFRGFEGPIRAHFHHNRDGVLDEVRGWISVASTEAVAAPFGEMAQHPPGLPVGGDPTRPHRSPSVRSQLEQLLPRLEAALEAVPPPLADDDDMDEEAEGKPMAGGLEPSGAAVAAVTATSEGCPAADPKSSTTAGGPIGGTENEDARVSAGAGGAAFDPSNLQRRMQEAAAAGNFILAGRLQEQLHALQAEDNDDGDEGGEFDGADGDVGWDDGEDGGEDYDSDDPYDNDGSAMGFPAGSGFPPAGFPPLGFGGGQAVFPPAGHRYQSGAPRQHSWGEGNQLGSSPAPAAVAPPTAVVAPKQAEAGAASMSAAAATAAASAAPAAAEGGSCRLRIRLPGASTSVVEDFGSTETLSAVYGRLQPLLARLGEGGSVASAAESLASGSVTGSVAPPPPGSGAFARPQSSAGFTLFLSRPKREFNLEMHGTSTLFDLGLAPSAALVVMRCEDRGVMRRGELEDRLTGADGDAMDVEGLTYEGLVELTERVGAAPAVAFGGSAEAALEQGTTSVSPADLANSTMEVVEEGPKAERDLRCPICLGEFDTEETEQSLRKLNNCNHVFHGACLRTWLSTKSACPVCKQALG